jgi:hypothetical protein
MDSEALVKNVCRVDIVGRAYRRCVDSLEMGEGVTSRGICRIRDYASMAE